MTSSLVSNSTVALTFYNMIINIPLYTNDDGWLKIFLNVSLIIKIFLSLHYRVESPNLSSNF